MKAGRQGGRASKIANPALSCHDRPRKGGLGGARNTTGWLSLAVLQEPLKVGRQFINITEQKCRPDNTLFNKFADDLGSLAVWNAAELRRCNAPKRFEMSSRMARWIKDEKGATSIEYALIASILSISIAALLPLIGVNLSAIFAAVLTGFH